MHSSQSASNAHPSRPHPKHRTSTSISDHLSLKRLLATPGTGERSPLKAAFGLGGKDKSKEEKAMHKASKRESELAPSRLPFAARQRTPSMSTASTAHSQRAASPTFSAASSSRTTSTAPPTPARSPARSAASTPSRSPARSRTTSNAPRPSPPTPAIRSRTTSNAQSPSRIPPPAPRASDSRSIGRASGRDLRIGIPIMRGLDWRSL
ncbi:hypothetical protein GGG16DRAFT_106320 [Schizophyllum commune]